MGAEEQVEHSWSQEDSSPNIYIKPEDPLTFHRCQVVVVAVVVVW